MRSGLRLKKNSIVQRALLHEFSFTQRRKGAKMQSGEGFVLLFGKINLFAEMSSQALRCIHGRPVLSSRLARRKKHLREYNVARNNQE